MNLSALPRPRVRTVCGSRPILRDLYFFTIEEAQTSIKQVERELWQSSNGRQLGNILDEYTNDRIQRGLCGAQSARDERGRLRGWRAGSLHDDISKLTATRAAGCYEQLIATPTLPPVGRLHPRYGPLLCHRVSRP